MKGRTKDHLEEIFKQQQRQIINSQRSWSDKTGLGYKTTFFKGSISTMIEKESQQKTYADIVKEESIHGKENYQGQWMWN